MTLTQAVTGQSRPDVLVLAGDRRADDPLLQVEGVAGKALIPVAGRPLLAHVLRALRDWPECGRLVVVAPADMAYRQAAAMALGEASESLTWLDACATLPASLDLALGLPDFWKSGGLVVTADHPMLSPEWLTTLWRAWQAHRGVAVAMVPWPRVQACCPGSRRTQYRFSDGPMCGANLFAFELSAMHQVLALWRQAEAQRKKPWKMVSLLGWATLARYVSGRLSRQQLMDALSKRLDVPLHCAVLEDGRAAVDVDSPADLALVRQMMEPR